MNTSCSSSGIIVLTTHERSGYFTSVLGDDVDLRYSPQREATLQTLLHNAIVAGGDLAVIDEAFFMDADDMAYGLESFVREESRPERLKLIVVCTQREEGDHLLAFLVMYCGIYNIIYGKTGVDVSLDLDRLVRRDNTRADVIHLAEAGRWDEAKLARERSRAERDRSAEHAQRERGGVEEFKGLHKKYLVDTRSLTMMSVQVDISAVLAGV